MKRPLRYVDIKKDGTYRVIAAPPHHGTGYNYWPLGKVGTVKWLNPLHGVNLVIQGQERLIKAECLEEVKDEQKTENKVTMNSDDVGRRYKVIKVPHFWDETDNGKYPVLNKIGRVKRVLTGGCLMYFGESQTTQNFLPYDCIESVPAAEIEDAYLIKQILRNPKGALQLIRGLSKMNKDMFCRAFVERGMI